MLSNAYFVANFGFDTAENEPAKNLQIFAKTIAKFANAAALLEAVPTTTSHPESTKRTE